jgi:hypothetical protein
VLSPVTLEVEQQVFPGLLALPIPISEPDESFMALGISAHNDDETRPRVLKAGLEGDAIAPDIDLPFALETAAWPLGQCVGPALCEPADRRGGEARRLWSQEGL